MALLNGAWLLLAASSAIPVLAAESSENRPFLAIWQDSAGFRRSEAPFLRVAVWSDGRIVFAKDPKKWGHELLKGQLEPARIEELKKALEKTGVFELKGTSYLVPDASVDCMMLDLGARQKILYWDEVESPGYGINIAPKPQHKEFMRCWKAVNKLALEAIPQQSQPYGERFSGPPKSWHLKPPIQSE